MYTHYTCVYVYTYMCICIGICICMYVYIYIYIYTHIHNSLDALSWSKPSGWPSSGSAASSGRKPPEQVFISKLCLLLCIVIML